MKQRCHSIRVFVPFRGEYYELVPDFPFLGVHFTRMIDDSVHAGLNAVLALPECYRRTDNNCADLFETLTFPGFWKLAQKYYRDGIMEMVRSVSKTGVRGESSTTPVIPIDR